MIYCQDSLSMLPIKLLNISLVGIDTEPKFTFTIKHPISTRVKRIKENLYVLVSGNYSKGLKKYGL